jgi:endo-1,4-beta-mannosidase
MNSLRFPARTEKPYLVGANYWATHAAHKMWQRWDADAVEKDLALAESSGINALRTFFWTPELNPLPGVVSEEVLGRFDEFLRIAAAHHVDVFPTFFVGHMSGVNWDIPWRQGRDFCADPYMVYWEADLVRRVVARFRGDTRIAGWILSNELPNYTGSLSPETATVWTRMMYQAVKEADPEALVSTGDGARCEVRPDYDGFRVEWVKDHVDWIGVHLYNYFQYEAGDSDELRKSYHIPCRLRYVAVGKPVMLEEFGLSDLIAGEEEAAGYYRAVLYSSLLNGSCGVLAWCLTDFDLGTEVPYLFQPHELTFGIADSGRRLKPQGKVLAEFSRFARTANLAAYAPAPRECAIIVPYSMYEDYPFHGFDRLRSYRLLEQAFTMAKMAGLDPDFVRSMDDLERYRFAVLPGGARLKCPEWTQLAEWVRRGGVLYYSYAGFRGGVYAQNFEELFGCRMRVRYGQLDQPEEAVVGLRAVKGFGDIEAGARFNAPRGTRGKESAYLAVEPTAATVVMEDGAGRPALLAHSLGAGRVFLCTYPIEYMLLNSPDENLATSLHALYGAMASEAGIRSRFVGKHPYLEAGVLEKAGSPPLLLVVNHAHRPIACSMRDAGTGATVDAEIEPKGVRRFELVGGRWNPV